MYGNINNCANLNYNLNVYDTVDGRDPAPDKGQFIMFIQLFYEAFYVPGGVVGLPISQDQRGNSHPGWSTGTGNDNGCLA